MTLTKGIATTFRSVAAIIVASSLAGAAESDWQMLFDETLTTDMEKGELARARLFDASVKLTTSTPDSASADLRSLEVLVKSSKPVRERAAATSAFVAIIRPKSSDVLLPFVPTLASLVFDNSADVQMNSVRALSAITPIVPESALAALESVIRGEDDRPALIAARGVLRSSNNSPAAKQVVSRMTASGEASILKMRFVKVAGVLRTADATTIELLRTALSDQDSAVVGEALTAVKAIGAKAIDELRPTLLDLSSRPDLQEASKQARELLNVSK